jgi:hypothetical protein
MTRRPLLPQVAAPAGGELDEIRHQIVAAKAYKGLGRSAEHPPYGNPSD